LTDQLGLDQAILKISGFLSREDRAQRDELCLTFSADPLGRLPGSIIATFSSEGRPSYPDAWLELRAPILELKGDLWVISAKARGSGVLHAALLYSRSPGIRKAYLSCRSADAPELELVSFYDAYPLPARLERNLSSEWQELEIPITPQLAAEAADVDSCQSLLEVLDRAVMDSKQRLVWDLDRVRDGLPRIAGSVAKDQGVSGFEAVLLLDNREKPVSLGHDDFPPQLRQKLAVRRPGGGLIGAELRLRTVH
jgi:hypothetical protein